MFAVVLIQSHIRCYSSKRVVHADQFVGEVEGFWTSPSVMYKCCPDLWLYSWALVAFPDSDDVTVWLDPN